MKKYKLGELLDVKRGASVSGEYFSTEGKLIRLTLGNFDYQNNGFKENTSKDNIYYIGDVADEFILDKNDIITPLTEQALGLLGSTAKIPESGKYIQTQDTALVKVNADLLNHNFAYYLLPTPMVKKQLSAGAQQTSIRHTSPDKIKDCMVYIPELNDQKKIASFLDNIDRKISLNRKANDVLESMAKQLYDYWFVQFDFPNAEGKPYKSSGGKMVYNETLKREIPEGWEVKPLSDVAEVCNGATPSTADENNYGGDIVWITPKDLSDQKSKFTFFGERNITQSGYESCSTRMLPKGTILLSSRAPIGLLSIASCEMCTNQGFKSIITNEAIDNLYLYFYLKMNMKQVEQLGSGTTFKEVSRESMNSLPLLYVSDRTLYSKWVDLQNPIFSKQEALLEETLRLTSLRDYLLPLLMNGQVKVS